MFQPASALPVRYRVLDCIYRKDSPDQGDQGSVHRIEVEGQTWCLKQISTEKRYAVRSIRRFEEQFPAASPVRRNSPLIGHHGHRLEKDRLLYFQEYLAPITPLSAVSIRREPAFRARLARDVFMLQRRLLQAGLLYSDLDERNLVLDGARRLRILDPEGLICADDSRVMALFFSFYSVNLASFVTGHLLQTGWSRARILEALEVPLFHRGKPDPRKVKEAARLAAGDEQQRVPWLEAILGQDPIVLEPEFYEYLMKLFGSGENRRAAAPAPPTGQQTDPLKPIVSPLPLAPTDAGLAANGHQKPAAPGAASSPMPLGLRTSPASAPVHKPASPGPVEHVTWKGQHVATIIRENYLPSKTTFVTPDNYYQQAGMVVYPKGGVVQRHLHLPIQRHLVGTSEALLVKRGRVEADLHAIDKSFLGTWTLEQGDLILLAAGGHGFRCLEDTILMEIKQGPYTGLVEKEHF